MSRLTVNAPSTTLCICIFFFFIITIPATCSSNESDFHALVAFKNAVDIDPQGALSWWNEFVHFCSWPGIFCGRKHQGRVVSIDLMSRGLVGTIPPHLGNLSFLRLINLQNNTFHGPIPQEIGRLRRLEYVEFSNNSLSGEITRNLSQCVNIYYLNLIDNDLTGSISLQLSSLVKLQALGLSKNKLSGTIPPFIGNFTNLKKLSLMESGMQGEIPMSFVQLQSLEFLSLAINNLTGRIPSGLFNISTMVTFRMSFNHLEGTIPSHMGFLFSKLKMFDLQDNRLISGKIPISLSNFSSLRDINLGINSFSGRLIIDLRMFLSLEYFYVNKNCLKGDLSFITSMINCSTLRYLDTSFNKLSGMLPYSITNLSNTNIIFFHLSGNQFHGSIPYGLGFPKNLLYLLLDNNYLTGPLPSDIGKLNKLEILTLSGNLFSHEIAIPFDNLTRLSHLGLNQNNFSGIIPPSLSNCRNLLTLNISRNNLNGGIPPEIFVMLSLLHSMDLSYNSLTGSVPSEVCSLENLERLHLSHNRLSGLLPNSLSQCIGLEHIYLQSNSFTGKLPEVLRNLRSVQYLDLSQNNLSGAIPSFLGELRSLVYLNMSFNKLEGEIPTVGVFLNETALSFEGNNGLCGGIPSLRFAPCSSRNSKKKHFPTVFIIMIPIVTAVVMISLLFCIFLYKRRQSKVTHSFIVPFETDHLRLSYGDLRRLTGGFSELNLLGAGRLGSVYKGYLENLKTGIAVKVLNLNVRGAAKSLLTECSALRGMRHRNLVNIVSVCSSTDFKGNDFKALVYEYMVNGDLDKRLHRNSENETRTLSLKQRVNIAIDIASGLEYLHGGTDSTIVHGDLKPSNILLDQDMTAHISDFGLSKVLSGVLVNESRSLGIRGTIGYIPPEYGLSGTVSTEGDTYSYGILLLELFTRKRPTNDEPNDSPSLRDLVRIALQSQSVDVVDPAILHECSSHSVKNKTLNCIVSVLKIGLACTNELPADRMLMHNVVNELRKGNTWLDD